MLPKVFGQLPPSQIAPWLGLGLGLVLELVKQSSSGAIVLEP